jgi:hypothetical protein
MTDQERVVLGIEVTPEKRQQIEEIAHRRGVDFAVSFLRALKRLHKKCPRIRNDVQPLLE